MEALALMHDWPFWQRAAQTWPPGDWRVWFINAGRGFGKTRTGAETVRTMVESGRAGRVALVAETAADARDVIVEGESGILAISPPWFRPRYEPSKRRLTWPNGAIATTYSGDDPDQLRGPQHDFALVDELAKYRYAQDTWDNLEFGLRLGDDPRVVVTTTPRPIPIIKALLADKGTVVTGGSTFENVENLAPTFRERVVARYQGTRLGAQELFAHILDDAPGALWSRATLDAYRVAEAPATLTRVVVGVDPKSGEAGSGSETGIVVAALGGDGRGYVLDDRSLDGSPAQWARQAVAAYTVHRADRIVAEKNQGGAMVEHTLRSVGGEVNVALVTASRGKATRAEPIAALYEQGRVSHVGMLAALEDQLCTWEPGAESPDRLDALVWALTELFPNLAPSRAVRPVVTATNRWSDLND